MLTDTLCVQSVLSVDRVDVKIDHIAIRLRTGALTALLGELGTFTGRREAA